MPVQLLPPDFDALAEAAVRDFWTSRSRTSVNKQGGTRDAVTSGKNMDAFIELVRVVARHVGLPETAVYTKKASVVLPGYFRATKNWDVLVIAGGRLLAVFEFKSQVGSLGNNGNNRSEEVLGAAADLWVAHQRGAFGGEDGRANYGPMYVRDSSPILHPDVQRDPRPPFLGWMMLLEESSDALRPVSVKEPHFRVFPEFRGASYAQRYQILCERMVERQLYGAAALVLTTASGGADRGEHRSLSEATSLRTLFAEFAGRVLAAQQGG